jgi:hypothetical protein
MSEDKESRLVIAERMLTEEEHLQQAEFKTTRRLDFRINNQYKTQDL